MRGQGRAGLLPAGLLVADEGVLQLAAGYVHSPHAPLAAASHLLTDTPHLCNQSMQRSVETRHAEQGVPVSFPYHLHPCAQPSGERRQHGRRRGGGVMGKGRGEGQGAIKLVAQLVSFYLQRYILVQRHMISLC